MSRSKAMIRAFMLQLVLGTRDYVRKCGFKQVIIGLSGGIDSALTAVIAADAVGAENVIGVGMPGPYSSEGSITTRESWQKILASALRFSRSATSLKNTNPLCAMRSKGIRKM